MPKQDEATCKAAISAGVVAACARDNADTGFIYLYADGTSESDQRSLLSWLLEQNLIPHNPSGALEDISFFYDIATRPDSTPDAKLSDFVDLTTGTMK